MINIIKFIEVSYLLQIQNIVSNTIKKIAQNEHISSLNFQKKNQKTLKKSNKKLDLYIKQIDKSINYYIEWYSIGAFT